MINRHLPFLFCSALTMASVSFEATAFRFSDGSLAVCVAAGQDVPEFNAGENVDVNFTGRTDKDGSGYRILWNPRKLDSLPPAMHDFLFFHECAHAQVPTRDELQANCVGLKQMRIAGRAGFAIEAKLAAFYGPGNDYWTKTLKCAGAGPPPPAATPKPP